MDIQVGDKVIFEDGTVKLIYDEDRLFEINQYINGGGNQILKIERPKYEVVEEKKELLTEEEKEFLKQYIIFSGEDTFVKYIIIYRSNNICFLNEAHQEINRFKIYGDKYFNKLVFDKQYTLKELGLEEK